MAELRRIRQFLGKLDIDNILSLDESGTGINRFDFVLGMLVQ